uniref:Alcohol dehydrogenase-11 n=1 Tax=Plutella xylostella TaxID=51655 RepID=A0A1Q3G5I3_PLUXY
MASVESSSKNGAATNLINKAPWTDEQGIGLKIYEGLVTFMEVLMLFTKMFLSWLHSAYRFIVPPEPKDVKGEIVLYSNLTTVIPEGVVRDHRRRPGSAPWWSAWTSTPTATRAPSSWSRPTRGSRIDMNAT